MSAVQNDMDWNVRKLTPGDAEACAALRREMLVEAPEAFLSSPADDVGSDAARVRERLAGGPVDATFGAFAGEELVGSVGVHGVRHRKAAYKLHVWGMYVRPDWRRRGAGRGLLDAAVGHARNLEGIEQVNLSVSDAAPEARALYEAAGFRVWGTEPRAMRHGGQHLAEHHMVLYLDGTT